MQLSSDPKIVKYLLTSQKRVVDVEKSRLLEIYNLTTKAACQLLGKIVTNLTEEDKTDIAELTGNVPLAIEIVGAILNYPNAPTVHSIIHDLKENPIPTLSQPEIHSSVNISIGLAYKYLPKELKIFGQYLSHFPGSFDSDSVHGMLERAHEPLNVQLKALVRCSLLQYRHSDGRFFFHPLIQKYFRNSASSDITFLFKIKFIGYFVPKLERLVQDHKDPNLFRAPYEWTLAPITQYIKLLMVEKHNFLQILPVLKSLEHESWIDVWNRLEYCNTSITFIQRLLTTLHPNELLTLLEMQNIFNGMLEILDSFTEVEITNMDSFMKLYSQVAAKAASLLFDQRNVTAAVNVFFSRKDKFEHTYKQHNISVETYIFFYTMLVLYGQMEDGESSEGCFVIDHYKKVIHKYLLQCYPNCDYTLFSLYYAYGTHDLLDGKYFREFLFDYHYQYMTSLARVGLLLALHRDYSGTDPHKANFTARLIEENYSSLIHIDADPNICFENVYYEAIHFFRGRQMYVHAKVIEYKLLHILSKYFNGCHMNTLLMEEQEKVMVRAFDHKCYNITVWIGWNIVKFRVNDMQRISANFSDNLSLEQFTLHLDKLIPTIIIMGKCSIYLRNLSNAHIMFKKTLHLLDNVPHGLMSVKVETLKKEIHKLLNVIVIIEDIYVKIETIEKDTRKLLNTIAEIEYTLHQEANFLHIYIYYSTYCLSWCVFIHLIKIFLHYCACSVQYIYYVVGDIYFARQH